MVCSDATVGRRIHVSGCMTTIATIINISVQLHSTHNIPVYIDATGAKQPKRCHPMWRCLCRHLETGTRPVAARICCLLYEALHVAVSNLTQCSSLQELCSKLYLSSTSFMSKEGRSSVMVLSQAERDRLRFFSRAPEWAEWVSAFPLIQATCLNSERCHDFM